MVLTPSPSWALKWESVQEDASIMTTNTTVLLEIMHATVQVRENERKAGQVSDLSFDLD